MKIKQYYSLRRNEKLISYNKEEELYLVKTSTSKTLYKLFINENEYKITEKNIENTNQLYYKSIIYNSIHYFFYLDKLIKINTFLYKNNKYIYFINNNNFYISDFMLNINYSSYIGEKYKYSTINIRNNIFFIYFILNDKIILFKNKEKIEYLFDEKKDIHRITISKISPYLIQIQEYKNNKFNIIGHLSID